jgi:hypothetical protein
MLSVRVAEWILGRVTTPDRAVSIVGDLTEESASRGIIWFWMGVLRTTVSKFWLDPHVTDERRLGLIFGLISGGLWMGLLLLGNLGGTSVFGNIRDTRPRVYGLLMPWFGYGGLMVPVLMGLAAAYRADVNIRAAFRVGLWSGFISGAICGIICLVTIMPLPFLFHDAMMRDPSNIHEFARSAGRPPTQDELSHFLYWDTLAGGFNMLWLGPLVGLTAGAIGAVLGKMTFRADRNRSDADNGLTR